MTVVFAVAHALLPMSFVSLWLASVGWTLADARRRCWDPRVVRAAVGAAAAVPIVGAALYALARPCEPTGENRARRVWRSYLEAELDPEERCLVCLTPLRSEFRCCPGCGDGLRTECSSCGTPMRIGWQACPACLEPVYASARWSGEAARVAA
jgi:hypothetical protein